MNVYAVNDAADLATVFVPWIPFYGATLIFLSALIVAVIQRRGSERLQRRQQSVDGEQMKPPSWGEVFARMERLEGELRDERRLREAVEMKLRIEGRRREELRDGMVEYVGRVQQGGDPALTDEERALLYPPSDDDDDLVSSGSEGP